jgi:hypothetical protein
VRLGVGSRTRGAPSIQRAVLCVSIGGSLMQRKDSLMTTTSIAPFKERSFTRG